MSDDATPREVGSTGWNWPNMAKVAVSAACVVAGAVAMIDLVGLIGTAEGHLLSFAAGAAGTTLAMDRWPCWR